MGEVKNRLAEALEIRNMKQVELAELTGLGVQSINSWKANRWQPKATPLHKMAKVLNVSELWLAGYDVPMERPLEQKKADELGALVKIIKEDERLYNIFSMISKLDDSQLVLIESLLQNIVKEK